MDYLPGEDECETLVSSAVTAWAEAGLRALTHEVVWTEDGDGDFALFVHVTLPSPNGPSWPREAIRSLNEVIREAAASSACVVPVYLHLRVGQSAAA